jgi:phosphoenolpyruvate carboxylase
MVTPQELTMPSSRPLAPPDRPAGQRPPKLADAGDAAAKNRPLVEDIRLLGRILGDVIREQEGQGRLRADRTGAPALVAYRLKADASAGRVLDRLLKNLSADQTVSVIRAFSYFSHLANIAEDRHHVRRRRTCTNGRATCRKAPGPELRAPAPRRPPRGRHRADAAQAYISPGAHRPPHRGAAQEHPGRRTRHRRTGGPARRPAHRPNERAANEALIRARVTQLWQTRMLRYWPS